ncbi:MAG: hypothetical protein ACI4FX_01385, partial [Agathobacter sp.]
GSPIRELPPRKEKTQGRKWALEVPSGSCRPEKKRPKEENGLWRLCQGAAAHNERKTGKKRGKSGRQLSNQCAIAQEIRKVGKVGCLISCVMKQSMP